MEESRGNQLPLPGERFCPMEDELVLFYLKPMLNVQRVPGRNHVVFDCDLYGLHEPWEIWEAFKTRQPNDLRLNKDIYFLTQHKKMSSTDKRVRRTVGKGTWKGDDSGKTIKSLETVRVVGLKKRFSYKNETSFHNGCWILYEFYLDRSLKDKKQKGKADYVLCLLRKNSEPKTKMDKKRKQREDEQEVLIESNYAFDDGGNSMITQQEEFFEQNEKRQRTVSSIDSVPAVPMPSEYNAIPANLGETGSPCFENDDDLIDFAASLDETLLCSEDYNKAPSGSAEAVAFQGEESGGMQQLPAEVQWNPSFPNDCGILLDPLPDEDFDIEKMLAEIEGYCKQWFSLVYLNDICTTYIAAVLLDYSSTIEYRLQQCLLDYSSAIEYSLL